MLSFVPEPLKNCSVYWWRLHSQIQRSQLTASFPFLTAENCLDKHEATSQTGVKNRKPCAMRSSCHWMKKTLLLSHLKALSAVHGMFWCYLAAVAGTRTPQWKAPILPEGHNRCSEIRNLALILIPHLRCSTKNVLRWSCYLRQQRYKPLDEPQKKFSPAPPFSGMEPLPPRWASTCTGTAETTKAFWESTERKTVLETTPTSDFDPNHHGFCSFWTWKCHEVL